MDLMKESLGNNFLSVNDTKYLNTSKFITEVYLCNQVQVWLNV